MRRLCPSRAISSNHCMRALRKGGGCLFHSFSENYYACCGLLPIILDLQFRIEKFSVVFKVFRRLCILPIQCFLSRGK